MNQRRLASIEVSEHAQERYMESARADIGRTVWSLGGCTSWAHDSHGEVTSMWPGSMRSYERLMARFEPAHHHMRAPSAAHPSRVVVITPNG